MRVHNVLERKNIRVYYIYIYSINHDCGFSGIILFESSALTLSSTSLAVVYLIATCLRLRKLDDGSALLGSYLGYIYSIFLPSPH